jgi:multidrug efflux system membrane fusion protein
MNYQEHHHPHSQSQTGSPSHPTPTHTRRVTIITTIAVMAVLALLYGFSEFGKHMMKQYFANNKPPPPPVSVDVAKTGELPQGITAIGSLTAVHQVTLSPEIAGRVTKFSFEAGTTVKQGTVLVQINDAPDQADLASAKAQERLANLILGRQRDLQSRGFASREQLDTAQTQHDAAVATIARLQAVIAQKQVRAPFDGQLGIRQVEAGQYVNTGAALVTLTDISHLYANFTIPEQARPQLALGQDLQVTVDAYPGRTFPGKISVLDPQVAPDTRTIKLQAVIDNAEHLLMPGMFVRVDVKLPSRANVVTIPEIALDHNIYGDFVYVVKNGDPDKDGKPTLKVVRATVNVTDHVGDRVAVTGVNGGDRVVTTGQIKLSDGAAVTLSQESVLQTPKQIPLE